MVSVTRFESGITLSRPKNILMAEQPDSPIQDPAAPQGSAPTRPAAPPLRWPAYFLAGVGAATAAFVMSRLFAHSGYSIWSVLLVIILLPALWVFLVDGLPRWRLWAGQQALIEEGIWQDEAPPRPFRLAPFTAADHESFARADGMHRRAAEFIARTAEPLVYLTGPGGAGKSSLLAAWVAPALASLEPAFATVTVRGYRDPLGQLRTALRSLGAPTEESGRNDDPRRWLEEAVRRTPSERLLVVVDPFEEVLALPDAAARHRFASLLASLAERPITGLRVVLAVDSEALPQLDSLGLPPLRAAEGHTGNRLDIPPFTRTAARDYLKAAGLKGSDALLDRALAEAAGFGAAGSDATPDTISPLSLNLAGLALTRRRGRWLARFRPGRLIPDTLRQAITRTRITYLAPKLLRLMVSGRGGHQPLSLHDLWYALNNDLIAQFGPNANPNLLRGCLLVLARNGIVRVIERVPQNREAETWEIAHPRLAAALGELLERTPPRLPKTYRPLLLYIGLTLWAGGLTAGMPGLLEWQLSKLRIFTSDLRLHVRTSRDDRYEVEARAELAEQSWGKFLSYLSALGRKHPLRLNLNGTGLSALDGLEKLGENLQSLRITLNPHLQRLPRLDGLPGLENLEITYQDQLPALAGLGGSAALRRLEIRGNDHLEKLPDLAGFPNLRELRIVGNDTLTHLPDLSPLSQLQVLVVSGNAALAELPPLEPLRGLQSLEVSFNPRLARLPELRTLDQLHRLAVFGNGLAELPAVEALAGLPRLMYAGIGENRAATPDDYRERLNQVRDRNGLRHIAFYQVALQWRRAELAWLGRTHQPPKADATGTAEGTP
jgi:hypothetical protein